MGKQRLERLLEQLKETQQQDITNAAHIYTVAQVAVDRLAAQIDPPAPAALPPHGWNRDRLKAEFGSFNACRSAARQRGITFSRTPTWEQLVTAFNYAEAIQAVVHHYLDQHPTPHLKTITFTVGDRRPAESSD
jgi:hypothetical protein